MSWKACKLIVIYDRFRNYLSVVAWISSNKTKEFTRWHRFRSDKSGEKEEEARKDQKMQWFRCARKNKFRPFASPQNRVSKFSWKLAKHAHFTDQMIRSETVRTCAPVLIFHWFHTFVIKCTHANFFCFFSFFVRTNETCPRVLIKYVKWALEISPEVRYLRWNSKHIYDLMQSLSFTLLEQLCVTRYTRLLSMILEIGAHV